MVKLVDTPGLGPGASCHAGSSPAARKGNFWRLFLNKKKNWEYKKKSKKKKSNKKKSQKLLGRLAQ